MKDYHKINTIFKRDEKKRIIIGDYSFPEFEYLKNVPWEVTEKINGTNICVDWNPLTKEIIIGGHNGLSSQIPASLFNKIVKIFHSNINMFISDFDVPSTIYCEGVGPGIQEPDGSKISSTPMLILIDVNINGFWLSRENCKSIADKFNINIVPFLGNFNLFEITELVKKGFKSQFGNLIAEGIVARPSVELFSRKGERIITKLKYKDFPPEERGDVELILKG
jgi:hypothetical protein